MADDPANSTSHTERRLAAILAADISGYSALMGADEDATVRDLKGHQSVVLPLVPAHGGRIIDTAGDGILAEFSSVLNAVKCAMLIQGVMAERNAGIDPARRMEFRIGVNQGDVITDGVRLFGDGVNIAARLETICQPGGMCISGKVYEEVRGKLDFDYDDAGEQNLKNITRPVRVYHVRRRPGQVLRPVPSAAQSEPQNRAAGPQPLLVLARDGITPKRLAELTGLSSATIDNALAGEFTDETRVRIESALASRTARPAPARAGTSATTTAPLEMGGYTRAAIDHYAGQYLTVRPSFSGNGTIYCYCTRIAWSDAESCLVFEEFNRPEAQYQHSGRIYIPPSSMFIHLVSLTKGAMRTVLVSQMGQTQEMRGLITTLANDTGALFLPACAPIVYQKRDGMDGQNFGHLTPDDPGYASFRALLQDTVRKSFVRWVAAT